MESRLANAVNFIICLYFLFWNEIFFGTSCHTKRHYEYIFTHPTTHLKRQTDVLRDKMGIKVAPNSTINVT